MKKLAAICIGIFVPCLIFEVVLEYFVHRENTLFADQSTPYYSWELVSSRAEKLSSREGILKLALHPTLVYRNLPNQHTQYFTIDDRGFRGPSSATGAATTTVLLLGGSAAFGTGLRNDGETLAAVLEKHFPGLDVTNGAVIGYQSAQELGLARIAVPDLRPDLILLFDGANDLSIEEVFGSGFAAEYTGFRQVEEQLIRLSRFEEGGPLVRIPRAVVFGVFPQLMKKVDLVWPKEGTSIAVNEKMLEKRAERYVMNIAELMRLASTYQSRVFVAVQPDLRSFSSGEKSEDSRYRDNFAAFRRRAGELLKELGVPRLDLNDGQYRFEAAMFLDPIHLNAAGTEHAAKLVVEAIVANGVISRGK